MEALGRQASADTWPDQRATRRELDDLARTDAPHRLHAGLDEESHMGIRTQAALGHQSSPLVSARMDRLHLRQVVREERRDAPRQEHTSAGMAQPQQSRHGPATPRPLLRRLADGGLPGRRIGPGAARAIDHKGARAMPSPVIQGGALHRAAEALEQQGKAAPRACGTSLTGGRRTEPPA